MRSLVAILVAVAFVASTSLARAEERVTAPLPGFCPTTIAGQAYELCDYLVEAKCAADASVRVDPRMVAIVAERSVYVGPREMGKPSGKQRDVKFLWFPTYVVNPDDPGEVVFAMNQYQSYRDLKDANARWTDSVAAVGEKAGMRASFFVIAPAKSAAAAAVKTTFDVAGAVAFNAPFLMMAPYTAGLSVLPTTALYAEALFMAPTGTAHGASEFVNGVRSRNIEQAVEGGAEFCGNVSIVLLTAGSAARFGGAVLPSRTAPISPFAGRVVPTLQQPRIVVTDSMIRKAMTDAPLKSQQAAGVSLPRIQEYVDRIQAGEIPPPIKVDGAMIVDGNHRYIAGRIAGSEPEIQPWAGGRPSSGVDWQELPIKNEVWEQ